MLHHFEDTNHSVILSFNDLSFWCFSCQAFLDALQIPQLLPLHQLVYALKFGESTDASLDARDSPKICKCGALSKMQLSWSKNNPGRRFYGCGNYNKSKCDYLNWYDPPTSLFHASLFNNFMEEIKKLKLEVEAHKASAREKFGALDNDVSTALYAEGLRYLQKEIKSLKVESEVQKKKLEVLERRVG